MGLPPSKATQREAAFDRKIQDFAIFCMDCVALLGDSPTPNPRIELSQHFGSLFTLPRHAHPSRTRHKEGPTLPSPFMTPYESFGPRIGRRPFGSPRSSAARKMPLPRTPTWQASHRPGMPRPSSSIGLRAHGQVADATNAQWRKAILHPTELNSERRGWEGPVEGLRTRWESRQKIRRFPSLGARGSA